MCTLDSSSLAKKADNTFAVFAYKKKSVLLHTIKPARPAVDSDKETLAVGEITREVAITARPAEEGEVAEVEDPDTPEADSDPPSDTEDVEGSDDHE